MARAGQIALVGRPNTGKSTLINRLVGEPVSIVTHKPQTTRHRITGLVTDARGQAVFVDTPGLHRRRDHALNRHLNRVAAETLAGVDLVVVVIDATRQTEEDRRVMQMARQSGLPVFLAINKIDRLADRGRLLPLTTELSEALAPREVFYISARTGDGVDALLEAAFRSLPEGEALHDPETWTTHSERFLAAERIRAELMEQLHQELPYGMTVVVESFAREPRRIVIGARIVCAEKRHKGMVIGQGGQTLKRIGSRARAALKPVLGMPVHLDLHVSCEPGWMDSEDRLAELGYPR